MNRVRTYYGQWGWAVADGGGWFPGLYDTEATARRAIRMDEAAVLTLSHIWTVDGEDRPVTMADLDTLENK